MEIRKRPLGQPVEPALLVAWIAALLHHGTR
jgi:hypothetical protein